MKICSNVTKEDQNTLAKVAEKQKKQRVTKIKTKNLKTNS